MKARVYIHSAATISHQPVFGVRGFVASLNPLEPESELIQPAYKEYIDPMALRRMSKILRMSITSAREALRQSGIAQPRGIIVGTGLGCLLDTEKFLSNFLTLEGLIPPTSFILSTHNTIAGQISLNLGCHSYNITHTQNTLSFETSLIDGIMKIEEGESPVLVGAADEHIPFLDTVAAEWGYSRLQLTSAASFYVLSGDASSDSLAEVLDAEVIGGQKYTDDTVIAGFLERNGLILDEIDLILSSGSAVKANVKQMDYTTYSGIYPTASAFAFHYGADYLSTVSGSRYVLIVNRLRPENTGLVLLKSIEA